MKTIDIFYQGEGIAALEHIEIGDHESFGDALRPDRREARARRRRLPVHRRRGRADRRRVAGREQGRSRRHQGPHPPLPQGRRSRSTSRTSPCTTPFAPGTTVARVKQWAAIHKFRMTEEEASHHHLQLAGTTVQPDPGTHIGALVGSGKCAVEFDLVSTPKVNG